ncbi:hypothetical protein BCh11DRAFT_05947 [Burkholderia sp. Ch1-1]|uniref:Lipoprotein n=1 Tax=Paraburkholderia dioscoreae TaxID=2604047 RepID=A0A5Q4YVV3_9BURK|nr:MULTISPECIES: hypothetical protein [Paraburkholderia]EIF30457.1 hypothetical protein BCh11DRAFT_05947 [Burkholderia sp. Ch1-1]MDR8395117.1 hypothetical protein [Paraburkholderia sp. USG1]VVD29448.1 conserved exported protein of unknown function [Paraburkholderia dioscoreae]
MKIRILFIACVTAAALLAGCTTVYKNTDACEQLMRSKLADTSADTLKIAHAGSGINGSRVVVEGSIEHVGVPASVASVASVTKAPLTASGAQAASAALPASAVSVGASGASGASATEALSLKPAKPQKIVTPAAAECTFHGPTLSAFNWLAPANLVTPAANATE